MAKRRKRTYRRIPLAVAIAVLPLLAILGWQAFSPQTPSTTDIDQPNEATTAGPAFLQEQLEQARAGLPRRLTDRVTLVDLHLDEANDVTMTLVINPAHVAEALRDMRDRSLLEAGRFGGPAPCEEGAARPAVPRTTLEIRASVNSGIYRTLTAEELLCGS